jgi:hypothetical protein
MSFFSFFSYTAEASVLLQFFFLFTVLYKKKQDTKYKQLRTDKIWESEAVIVSVVTLV